MAASKPEIYLEIGAGFFRIPTPEANYNITVLDTGESTATKVVEKIVEVEKDLAETVPERVMEAVSEGLSEATAGDDFYREISSDIYNDIGKLAKNLSSTLRDIPAEDRLQKRAELDEAGDKIEDAKNQLKDIVEMTEQAAMKIMDKVEDVQGRTDDVKDLLSNLKNHTAFLVERGNGEAEEVADEDSWSMDEEAEGIAAGIDQALELLNAIRQDSPAKAAAAPPAKKKKKTRYLFDLDVVFQTLYELCTNETVKEHISKARANAGEIFAIDAFYDAISPKAAKYEADSDNFYTVPMSDVFTSLYKACKDKGIGNLLKKMDAGQSSIFLDQTIPLEVPPTEEIEVEVPGGAETEAPPAAAGPDPRLEEVMELLGEGRQRIKDLPNRMDDSHPRDCSAMTIIDQQEIFERIEDAFTLTSSISNDVSKILEALSFQDLSGQRIMKIIKLLSDFQVQLLALVVSFGSQLKHKEKNADITLEESKKLAQDDVDNYINKITGAVPEEGGVLDQDTVNRMLEEMGF